MNEERKRRTPNGEKIGQWGNTLNEAAKRSGENAKKC